MGDTSEVIDLRERQEFLDQYITLRNKYVDLLLTSPVTHAETKKWLKNSHAEIRGIVQDDVLAGAVILYLDKNGEIAFFVKETNKGIGSKLLDIIKEVACKRRFRSVWAWVLQENTIAQKTFEKNGFVKRRMSKRVYKGKIKQGIEYIAKIMTD